MYALKSSEYAQFVAGHGKQHVGFPGSCDIGAQNLPSMTGERQHETSPQQLTSDSHPPFNGNLDSSKKGARQSPCKYDIDLFAILDFCGVPALNQR
jgi:hypothetical protein